MIRPITVVKVGGSLFGISQLGDALQRWFNRVGAAQILLVPGGGPTADVVRAYDRDHHLGEEKSHWLALRALTFNAHFLAGLLPGGVVVDDWRACRASSHQRQ